MNAKERLLRALQSQPVDRPPVAALATGITVDMMEKSGIYWPEAHTDADKLAGLAETIWLYTGIESIKLPFCMTIEVEALGAEIDYRTIDTLPTEKNHLWEHPDELAIPEDFLDRGRIPTVLEAISQLRHKYDQEVAIVSSIVGPFSLGAKLFGFDNFLIWLLTDPDYVHRIMERLTGLAIYYANKQVEAGADVILIGEATCTGDLISPDSYRDFIAPYHSQLCPGIQAPNVLHICGKSTNHTKYIADVGANAYNFDEGVDVTIARGYLHGKMAMSGNVPTVSVLLNGTPEDVYLSSMESLQNGIEILTPGCALPPYTPLKNIKAMVQAVRAWIPDPA